MARTNSISPGRLAGFHFRLVHLDTANQSERVVDAIRATTTDTDEDIAEMEGGRGYPCHTSFGRRAWELETSGRSINRRAPALSG